MSEFDRQRVAAVRKLEALGYRFADGEWVFRNDAKIAPGVLLMAELVKRREALEEYMGGERESVEWTVIVDTIDVFQALWQEAAEPDYANLPWVTAAG